MDVSRYQQLHPESEEIIENTGSAEFVDAELSQYPKIYPRTPCPAIQDQAERQCHDSRSSEPTPQISNSSDEGHLPQGPEESQHDIPLLSDAEMSNLSASVDMRDDDSENGLQAPGPDQSAAHTHPTWTDPYFRPLFLTSLAVFLILMIAVLEVLHHISQQNQGLVTVSENMHYVWTYGPTFVLNMVAAVWGQLELRARQMMPWCLMSRGEAPAQNSLMLNYITSSMPGSLVLSLKRRHFLVSIGICGSLILRLMIIFASGLLRLEYRSLAYSKDIRLEDVFNFNKNANDDMKADVTFASNVLKYWAILSYDLPYPHGVTSQFAVQSFVTDDGVYDELMGQVQVFESSLESCESFSFVYNYGDLDLAGRMELPLERAMPASLLENMRPWCRTKRSPNDIPHVADGPLYLFVNSTELIYKCANSTSPEDREHRILFTFEYYLSSNESEISGFNCEPKHSLTRRTVTNTTRDAKNQDALSIAEAFTETQGIGVTPLQMTKRIFTSFGDASLMPHIVPHIKWNWWYDLLNASQPQNNLWSFRNTSLVAELSQRTWKSLTAYVVKQDYTYSSDETIKGTATSTQSRLCVQQLSLRLIEAHITLLFGILIALYFMRPGVFHRDPTSLGAGAMILARSPGLVNHLRDYGVASKQVLRESLSGYLASLSQRLPPDSPAVAFHHFQKCPKGMDVPRKSTANKSVSCDWWSPLSVRWWFRICLMTTILALVTALEVLLQLSNRKRGLGYVNLDGYLKYTWNFLPTLVLVLVGLLYSMVDSTTRTLHAFHLLRKGRATLEDILHDPTRQLTFMAVVYAASKRHFVLLWATLPALLAPMLTVIISGLYTVELSTLTYDTELELKDWFRPVNRTVGDYNDVPDDNSESWTAFTLTQFSNMSYPQWTHGEYALVSFEAPNLRSHDNDSSFYITARVPAARSNLNCSLIGHYVNDTYPVNQQSNTGPKRIPVNPRPLGCGSPPEWNGTTERLHLYLSSFYSENVDGSGNTLEGYYLVFLEDDDHLDNRPLGDGYDSLDPQTTSIRVCGDERQHYFIGLGYGTQSLSVLHCVPYVEALWVHAAFALPDLSLVTDVPLSPDRDSAVFLSDSASMTAFRNYDWEELVPAVVNGSSGVGQLTGMPPGPGNNDTDRLIASMESVITQYLAQKLHFNYRESTGINENNDSASSPGRDVLTANGHQVIGTVTDHTQLRLIQNAAPTRVLQGLLAVMGACLVASTVLGRGERVIPRDPGSVASQMAYFAGGEVWRRVPVGADRWTDEQIKKHGLGISGGKLLLDWWGDDREDSGDGTRGKKFAIDSADRKEMS